MVRTRAVPRRRPNINPNPRARPDIDFQAQRVAATKEQAKRVRASDVKIKFLLPRVKDVEVKTQWKRRQKDESSKSCKTWC